jgi:hypothetical protein
MQHPSIYFYNIKIKDLQHTSEMLETLETYICNIGEEKAGPVDSGRRGRSHRRVAARERHPRFMSALGSAGKHLRCHATCAPAAMVESVAWATTMGDGRTDGEGASDTCVWDGREARSAMGRGVVRHGAVADEGGGKGRGQ